MWITDWTARAACKGTDPDEFFVQGAAQNRSKLACRGCPVRTECLADALDNRLEFGIWGGMTERERRALLRRRPDVTDWSELLNAARIHYERTGGELAVTTTKPPAKPADSPSNPRERTASQPRVLSAQRPADGYPLAARRFARNMLMIFRGLVNDEGVVKTSQAQIELLRNRGLSFDCRHRTAAWALLENNGLRRTVYGHASPTHIKVPPSLLSPDAVLLEEPQGIPQDEPQHESADPPLAPRAKLTPRQSELISLLAGEANDQGVVPHAGSQALLELAIAKGLGHLSSVYYITKERERLERQGLIEVISGPSRKGQGPGQRGIQIRLLRQAAA